MRISLIICTRDRADRLRMALQHVGRLEAPRGGWQLVLVDNGSTDHTPAVLRGFLAEAGVPAVVVEEPRRGLARARNAGLARAAGDLLAFTDDDCYVRPDFLVQICAALEAPDLGYIGGRVVLHDPCDAPITIKDVPTPCRFEPRRFLPPGSIHGANMTVRRAVVATIGGFDPLLGPGAPGRSADDIDMLARACWAGWAGAYDPRPVVAHHHGRRAGPELQRLRREYAFAAGAYFLKGILRPGSRAIHAREWLRHTRDRLREGHLRMPVHELAGALCYGWARLWRGERPPTF
jgi:hypothetical protein